MRTIPRQHQRPRVWSSHAPDRLPAIRQSLVTVAKVEANSLGNGLEARSTGQAESLSHDDLRTEEGSSADAAKQPSISKGSGVHTRKEKVASSPHLFSFLLPNESEEAVA